MGLIADYLARKRLEEQQGTLADVYSRANPVMRAPGPDISVRPDVRAITSLLGPGQIQAIAQQLLMPQQGKPTNLMQNAAAAGIDINTPEGQKAFLDILKKPTTQVNLGENKVLGKDAVFYRNDKGEMASAMDTVASAIEHGYTPVSNETLKTMEQTQQAAPVVGNLFEYAFGTGEGDSLFPDSNKTVVQRGISGMRAWLDEKSQSNDRLVNYNSTKRAFLTGMARLSGQVGQLTDRDVELVSGLFPTPGFTPEKTAKSQFKNIGEFLLSKGVPRETLIDNGLPEWAVGLPKGIPQGSIWIGVSPQGQPIYQAPDGSKHVPD